MHTPEETKYLISHPHDTPRRIALQGPFASGKTTAALSWPNILPLDFDHNLPLSFSLPSIPFWNPQFIKDTSTKYGTKQNSTGQPPNRRDFFRDWLRKNAPLFTPEQTIFLDSWTFLQNAVDMQSELEPEFSPKTGERDKFVFWNKKLQYAVEYMEMLKGLNCTLIVAFHESPERNDRGELTGKVDPLMAGSFKDQLGNNFTDWYRAILEDEKDSGGRIVKTRYYWQMKSDGTCKCRCSLPAVIAGKLVDSKGAPTNRVDITDKSAYEVFKALTVVPT